MERSQYRDSTDYWTAVMAEELEKYAAGEVSYDEHAQTTSPEHIQPEPSPAVQQQFSPDVVREAEEEREGLLDRAFRIMPAAVQAERANMQQRFDHDYRSSNVMLRPKVENTKTSGQVVTHLPFRTLAELIKGL